MDGPRIWTRSSFEVDTAHNDIQTDEYIRCEQRIKFTNDIM